MMVFEAGVGIAVILQFAASWGDRGAAAAPLWSGAPTEQFVLACVLTGGAGATAVSVGQLLVFHLQVRRRARRCAFS